jgi:hypothetical protein
MNHMFQLQFRKLPKRYSIRNAFHWNFHAACETFKDTEKMNEKVRDILIWPDGTPKKFQGKENEWKNWINFDTDHNDLTDRLNRLRHFFWEVDARGKLWRLEIDQLDQNNNVVGLPPKRCGQMKESKILDFFFPKLKKNNTNMYTNEFPFLVQRAHEMYFCRTGWNSSSFASETNSNDNVDIFTHSSYPIVFNNLIEFNSTNYLRYSCPGSGHIVKRIDTIFNPSTLRTDSYGRLFHPVDHVQQVSNSGVIKDVITDKRWGLLESAVVQHIATELGDMSFDEETSEMNLIWKGSKYPLKLICFE